MYFARCCSRLQGLFVFYYVRDKKNTEKAGEKFYEEKKTSVKSKILRADKV